MSNSYSQDYERLRKNQQSFQSEHLNKNNQHSRNSHEKHEMTSHGNIIQNFDNIPDPGERYQLDDVIGKGVYGTVYSAVDIQAGHKKVAVKVQNLFSETREFIMEEYRVFLHLGGHPNIPNFYGIYRKRSATKNNADEIWFILELCDGGTVMDVVRELTSTGKKLKEEHIRYVLREVIKAVHHLHEKNIIHRDIKGDNIVLTKEGEVKLVDFGFAKVIKNSTGNCYTRIGSPSWVAPEVAACENKKIEGYNIQADVWSIGITAIELAEGKAPYEDMHPTRTLFQIMRNPPPGLRKASNWSANFIDFITECLEKNPENRPAVAEILSHPFIEEETDNNFKVMQDVKSLLTNVRSDIRMSRPRECIIYENRFQTNEDKVSKIMLTEDLASLKVLTEESILTELYQRLHQGDFHTFVGDTLLILNPNELQDIYGNQFHDKYNFKSRSDNEPHIYSVADKAYQDLLHNEEKQHIVFAGESKSGKTSNAQHLINHFIYLGKSLGDVGIGIKKAIDVIHAFCHTSSPLNENSTRCIYQTQLTFGPTGKASGAIFSLFQLEKWCVSTTDKNRSNFFIFYYFYDSMNARGKLKDYKLPPGRKLHYLRAHSMTHSDKPTLEVRNNPQENCHRFDKINEILILMGMESHVEFIWKALSAILLIGEVGFKESSDGEAVIENIKAANIVAELIGLDEKKFAWSLTNYCVIKKGAAIRRKYTCEEAGLACDVLACTLYQRLVDWMINFINSKLAITRTVFGDKYIINILDLFGFECFDHNRFEQLIVNTTNEQLQCYYNQRVFAWEMQEHEEELIPSTYFNYYDNQETIEQLMGNKYGIFQIIDEASRQLQDTEYISKKIEYLGKKSHINMISSHQFSVAHYTGKVVYDIANIVGKNRDFVSPEMINTMRLSSSDLISQLFTGKLTKTGNLISDSKSSHKPSKNDVNGRSSLSNRETSKMSKYNVAFKEQYSQTRKMRTCISTFRSVCLEILKKLSINSKNGGVHFVRCIRADLDGKPRNFNHEIVRQQIRALGILETARSRQQGYAYRIAFSEFLRRYQFLAFDFGESVDTTKDNCRLLLVRLKMEGWIIGKSKVFLKYYNEEYLSRLYEIQVRKIVKIQSMLRAFLACKKLNKAAQKTRMKQKMMNLDKHENNSLTEDDAALMIQKTYRGHTTRKEINSQKSTWDENTFSLMQYYCIKWKSHSIYQILLYYRAFCFHQLGQFSQQVHLFDRSYMFRLNTMNQPINLNEVNLNVKRNSYIGENPRSVYKLPFDFYQEFLDFNVASISKSSEKIKKTGSISSASDEDNEAWNAPFQRANCHWNSSKFTKKDIGVQTTNSPHRVSQNNTINSYSIINTPFTRDPRASFDSVHNKKLHNNFTHQKFVDHHSTDKNRQWNESIPSHENYSNWSSKNGFHNDDSNKKRTNPISELQTLGRRNDNNESDTEPPFNFQAMLRKTTHQRQSMKRNYVYESNMPSMMKSEEYIPMKNSLTRGNGVTNQIKNSMGQFISGEPYAHTESLGYSSNKMFSMPDKYTTLNPIEAQSATRTRNMYEDERTTDNLVNKRAAFNSETKVAHTGLISFSSVELAPGVTVKGYCTEF